jgi:hypothetical protein
MIRQLNQKLEGTFDRALRVVGLERRRRKRVRLTRIIILHTPLYVEAQQATSMPIPARAHVGVGVGLATRNWHRPYRM